MKRWMVAAAFAVIGTVGVASAHNTWVETNTAVVRVGDLVTADLFLGNHGNAHRDFKVAGKTTLEQAMWDIIDPAGKHYDLKSDAVDEGYTPKEGYWLSTFSPDKEGLYLVTQRSDSVVTYAPERSVHGAKTFFLASKSLDHVPIEAAAKGYNRVVGMPLELVPLVNPIVPMGPGTEMRVKLLFEGTPLPGAVVSFIPRGATLKPGLDDRYERMTNADGIVSYEVKEAGMYLIVAHREEPQGGTLDGKAYTSTKYGATLTVNVPAICPCCGE